MLFIFNCFFNSSIILSLFSICLSRSCRSSRISSSISILFLTSGSDTALLAGDIDFDKGYDFLDKELKRILREAKTGKRIDSRLFWKITLVKRLYENGYKKEDILLLYKFIDWLISLPDEENEKFRPVQLEF